MKIRLGLAIAIVASAMALMGPAKAQTLTSTADSAAGANAIAIANGGGSGSGASFPNQAPSLGAGSYGSANPCGEWIGAGFSMPMGGLNFNSGSTNKRCQDLQTASQFNAMAAKYNDPRFVLAAQLALCNDLSARGYCENAGIVGRPGQQAAAQPAAYYGYAQAAPQYAQPAAYAAPAYAEQAYGYAGYGQAGQPSYQAAGYGHAYAARGPMLHAYVEASVPANAVRPPWCATVSGQAFKYPECQ